MKKSMISLVLATLLGITLALSGGCCHMARHQCGKPACCDKTPCCAKPCCAKPCCDKPCGAQTPCCDKAPAGDKPCCPTKTPAGTPKAEEKK